MVCTSAIYVLVVERMNKVEDGVLFKDCFLLDDVEFPVSLVLHIARTVECI